MHATAMGLLVAIPVMVVYSFLHDKQSKLFADVDRCSSQVIEFLNLRGYVAVSEKTVFPEMANLTAKGPKTPPSTNRAS